MFSPRLINLVAILNQHYLLSQVDQSIHKINECVTYFTLLNIYTLHLQDLTDNTLFHM